MDITGLTGITDNNRHERLAEITTSLLYQQVATVVLTAPRQAHVEIAPVIRQLRAQGMIVVPLTRYLEEVTDVDYIDRGAPADHAGRPSVAATRRELELTARTRKSSRLHGLPADTEVRVCLTVDGGSQTYSPPPDGFSDS
jgi:hypothetical protein